MNRLFFFLLRSVLIVTVYLYECICRLTDCLYCSLCVCMNDRIGYVQQQQ